MAWFPRPKHPRTPQHNTRAGLEPLEDRSVPTVTPMMNGTELVLTGDGDNDLVRLDRQDGQFQVEYTINAAGDTTITFFPEAALTSIRIAPNGGTDKIEIQRTAPGKPVTVNTGAGMDAVDLGDDSGADANGLSGLEGIVTVEGGGDPDDRLTLNDQANPARQHYIVRSTYVARQGAESVPINYADVGELVFNGTDYFDRYTVRSLPAMATVEVNGRGGNNVLQMPNTPNDWAVTGLDAGEVNGGHVRFTGIPVVGGGTDTDHFVIHPAGRLSGIVSGGLGSNTLDYSLWTTPVRVNLAASSATGVANGDPNQLAGIDHVIGGASDDILIGNANANMLTGGAGRDLLIGREGADLLDGGAGDNILIGCSTAYDLDNAALSAVMAEWVRTDLSGTAQQQYDTRIDHLKTGRGYNGQFRLRIQEVVDDGAAADALTGGADLDWFFLLPGDLAVPDANEEVN